ncbi:MAG: alpha/beta fold hydrolase [Acidobacteriota bacterium]
MKNVLLTGADSLVGAEVLAHLARQAVDTVTLVLGHDGDEVLDRLVEYVGPLPVRFEVIAGDVRQPRFGLDREAWRDLGERIDCGFHCAQLELPGNDLDLARQGNVRPVENWIRLLGAHPHLRLAHLSTAFVGGRRNGLFTEFDLDCGQTFRNPWEESKFAAEERLRESPVSPRVTVFRPSHVVGSAQTGEAFAFTGAYPLLFALAGGGRWLPGDKLARLDLVPADYVGEAMVTLMRHGQRGGTFHLAGGWKGSLELGELAQMVAGEPAAGRRPRFLPQLMAPLLRLGGALTFGALSSRGAEARHLADYLRQGCVFDTFLADAALEAQGVVCPEPAIYLGRVLRAAARQDWGRRQRQVETLAQPVVKVAAEGGAAAHARGPAFEERKSFRVKDYEVVYRDIGSGPAVVFLHGFAGAEAWDGVVERLQDRYRCLIVETLGLGESRAPLTADYGLPAQAAMIRGLLSHLGLERVHLVGNDTGGAIAQLFAVRWPEVVDHLVLSDCDAFDNWPPPQVERLRKVMRLPGGMALIGAVMSFRPVARSRSGFRRLVTEADDLTPQRVQRYLRPVSSAERRSRLRRFFLSLDPACTQDIAHLLQQLDNRTLIIWGCEDDYWSTSWAQKLYEEIPGAERLELIPFAGISCHEERPDRFAEILSEFFAGGVEKTDDRGAGGTESELVAENASQASPDSRVDETGAVEVPSLVDRPRAVSPSR